MKIKAAVVANEGDAFKIENLDIDEPAAHEVRTKLVATGLCHTDLAVRDGQLPGHFPVVLGHEGAGIVEKIGTHVTSLAEGDRVVLSYGSCGTCGPCETGSPAYCQSFNPLNFLNERQGSDSPVYNTDTHGAFFQQSSFATYALAHERNVVKVTNDTVDISLLGPLGCGIQTGAGAVLNTAHPRAGQSIAIVGVGSVGLAAVMAAKVAGCDPIIAVDMNDARLDLAKELGATHAVNAETAVPDAIREVTPNGVDYVIECSGVADAARSGWESLANLGTLVIVGAPPSDTDYNFDANTHILTGRRIVGCVEGDSVVKQFIPKLISLYSEGRFPFDRLIKTFPFEDINKAVHEMESGDVIKPVLLMD